VETERETFRGDRVLVTVPGPLVSELGFDPVLPTEKVRALLQLQYGNGTRLVAQYADKEAVRGAIGLGCFTDQMPGYIMEQTMQQPGDHIVISGLAVVNQEWIMPELGEELMKPHADDGSIQFRLAGRRNYYGPDAAAP